jgi:trans-aconitate methyltransferase
MSEHQKWPPYKYQKNAYFVSQLGMPLIDLLAPQKDEYILDLGCGDGTLMVKIAELGCRVMGVDSSPEMVSAAQTKGLEVYVMDGEKLSFNSQFDAVFSNAALHWMTNPDAVIQGVYQALKPNGRFVAELGGAGNVATVVNALIQSMVPRINAPCSQTSKIDINSINPWYFPTLEDYQYRLEKVGFTVEYITLFERPTPLPEGIIGWLEMFAQQFTAQLPLDEREDFIHEVIELCESKLCDGKGNWIADYVRLRFSAIKK